MIEHPVPQNVTTYEFHLIGNMTIKQFLILLAGAGVGFFFYATNLLPIIKWPLVIVSVLFGIAMAFVPYEERSLDQWFINFIRAIYRPTKYYWRRTAIQPAYFSYSPPKSLDVNYKEPDFSPLRRQQVASFLSSIPTQGLAEEVDPLDMFSRKPNDDMVEVFENTAPAQNVQPGIVVDVAPMKPSLQVRAHPLRQQAIVFTSSDFAAPNATEQLKEKRYVDTETTFTVDSVESMSDSHDSGADTTKNQIPEEAASLVRLEPVVLKTAEEKIVAEDTAAHSSDPVTVGHYVDTSAEATPQNSTAVVPAVFRKDLPFPKLPDKPGIILGMVHDSVDKIIPGAIVEILDTTGTTVRAMKTNNLGQFFISSPLDPGDYTLETDKENLKFPTYGFTIAESVLDPIDIRATA